MSLIGTDYFAKVGCVGQGFVGGSLTTVMSRYMDVYTYDISGKVAAGGLKTESMEDLVRKVGDGGIVFVCVPTPMIMESGRASTHLVENVLESLMMASQDAGVSINAVIKSTVPPGTTLRMNSAYGLDGIGLKIMFNPEFLTEANAVMDFAEQDRIIIGTDFNDGTETRLEDIYRLAFPRAEIVFLGSKEAEMVKYVINCFLAVKVSLANEFYDIAESIGVNYDIVIDQVKKDNRMGQSHWSVPGPVEYEGRRLRGFGGHCFPKDLNGLIYEAKRAGVDPIVMESAWKKNLQVREISDWEHDEGRAVIHRGIEDLRSELEKILGDVILKHNPMEASPIGLKGFGQVPMDPSVDWIFDGIETTSLTQEQLVDLIGEEHEE